MKKKNSFWTVVRFEFTRSLTKPSFWISSLLIPLLVGAVALVMAWSAKTTEEASDIPAAISFEYSDETGLISTERAAQRGGTPSSGNAIEKVKAQELSAYIAYPNDPATQAVAIYATDRGGPFGNALYTSLAQELFRESVDSHLPAPLATYVHTELTTNITAFDDGLVTPDITSAVLPALLVLIFMVSLTLLGNQMLNSTVDEKKNRTAEMLLVVLRPSTLIRGKFTALGLTGAIQLILVLATCVLLYVFVGPTIVTLESHPAALTIDAPRLALGALVSFGGLLLALSTLVAIGSALPSPKEAAPFFSIVVIATIAPLYVTSTILVTPESSLVQVLSYVPVTAPMTALIRNAAGSLPVVEGLLIASGLVLLGLLVMQISVRIYEHGIVHPNRRLALKEIMKGPRC